MSYGKSNYVTAPTVVKVTVEETRVRTVWAVQSSCGDKFVQLGLYRWRWLAHVIRWISVMKG